jgi:hypothetical protein
MTTALPAGAEELGAAAFGTVGFDADFALEEPHAATASVAAATRPRRKREDSTRTDMVPPFP